MGTVHCCQTVTRRRCQGTEGLQGLEGYPRWPQHLALGIDEVRARMDGKQQATVETEIKKKNNLRELPCVAWQLMPLGGWPCTSFVTL